MNETQMKEFTICKLDMEYFIENYFVIPDGNDYKNIDMTESVKKIINCTKQYEKFYIQLPRQSGVTTTLTAILLHKLIFENNKRISYDAHNQDIRCICDKLFFSMEQLPLWMKSHIGILTYSKEKQSIINDNRTEIIFDSKVILEKYKGQRFDLIILDYVKINEAFGYYLNMVRSKVILNNMLDTWPIRLRNFNKCC